MPQIIKDNLPLTMAINEAQEKAARNHGIPVFKGKLFRHSGNMNENLDKYGRPVFEFVNSNTVVIGGAIMALERLFHTQSHLASDEGMGHKDTSLIIPTINQLYNINADASNDYEKNGSSIPSTVCTFGVGVGGSGLEFGSAYDPDFKTYTLGAIGPSTDYVPTTWIPFRVSPSESIGSSAEVYGDQYYMRDKIRIGTNADEYYAWYLKEFSNDVNIRALWQDTPSPSDDGSPVTIEAITEGARDDLIECFAECVLTITEDDLREYYLAAGNLQQARFNQIGLFSGTKVEIGTGYYDYVNVRLFSVVNFDNVSVKEASNNVYLYRIYAAV